MSESLKEKIRQLSLNYFQDTVALRRHIHQHPELSGEEYNTAKFIADTLKSYGITPLFLLNNTAVTALIEGKNPTFRTVALRADMDALPITENNNLEFRSVNSGIMHACGHDVHVASLLTTARILQELKDYWEGSIKLIFQPSEEKFPGGAIQLIDAGILKNPKVDAVLGLHVSPEIETGKIGIKSGNYMASTDEIYIKVTGKGGHAAIAESFINPLIIASKILIELESFYRKHSPDSQPGVLTFGRITGEGRTNIVPETVQIDGTLRTFNEKFRFEAHKLITDIVQNIARQASGKAEVFMDQGYPVLKNDEKLTQKVFSISQDFLGKENVLSLEYRMTAEDFAYYSHRVPSVFYRLGVKIDNFQTNLHSSDFMANEDALQFSPALMAYLAVNVID
jgi:amidohydrolase